MSHLNQSTVHKISNYTNSDIRLDKKHCNVIVTGMTQQAAKQTVTVMSTEDYFPTLASIQKRTVRARRH